MKASNVRGNEIHTVPVILEIGGTLDYQIQEPVRGSKDLYIVFFKELNEQF